MTLARLSRSGQFARSAATCRSIWGKRPGEITAFSSAARQNESRGQRTRRTAQDDRPDNPRHADPECPTRQGADPGGTGGPGRVDGVHLADRGRAPPARRAAAGADRRAGSTPPSTSCCTGSTRTRRPRPPSSWTTPSSRSRRGEADEALARTAEVLELTENGVLPELAARASYLRALAFEAAGRVDDAILALEDLSDGDGPTRLTAAIALSRCYRETGDLARAIDTGERALRRLEEYQLDGSDEAVQLAVTIAAAHFERGDVDVRRPALPPGHRACRAARLAEGQGLGVLERQRHGVRTRAPSTPRSPWPRRPWLCSSWATTPATWPACARSSASASSGWTRPRSRTPGPTSSRPPSELAWSSASPIDSARNDIALARARYLAGDLAEAGARATQILESFREQCPDGGRRRADPQRPGGGRRGRRWRARRPPTGRRSSPSPASAPTAPRPSSGSSSAACWRRSAPATRPWTPTVGRRPRPA